MMVTAMAATISQVASDGQGQDNVDIDPWQALFIALCWRLCPKSLDKL
jgi:hypothetical protein